MQKLAYTWLGLSQDVFLCPDLLRGRGPTISVAMHEKGSAITGRGTEGAGCAL